MRKYYSRKVVDDVKEISAIDYLEKHEPDNLVRSGGTYRTRKHDSLYLSNGCWRWVSQGRGGSNAISYLQQVEGMSFVEAIGKLCTLYGIDEDQKDPPGTEWYVAAQKRRKAEIEEMIRASPDGFRLPIPAEGNKRLYAFLSKRGISKTVITYCTEHKLIYQDEKHGNVVFVGYDDRNIPRCASLRSTGYRLYRGEVPGSRKEYMFRIVNDEAEEAHLFEAPLDLLSYATLMEMHGRDFREVSLCAMGGALILAENSTEIPKTIATLLDGRNIRKIYLHLDNDLTGMRSAASLEYMFKGNGIEVVNELIPPERGKDVNDMLLSMLAEKMKLDEYPVS